MLAQIFLVHLAAMASPGPNVLLVTRTAIAESRRAGLYSAGGIATGSGLWALAAAVGLALVLVHVSLAYDALRLIGGLYLIYLGVSTFRSGETSLAAAGGPTAGSARRALYRGVLTNLTNPKAAVFFLSIFATLLPADSSLGFRSAAVALILIDAWLWHSLLAVVFSTRRAQAGYQRVRRWIDRGAGTVMAGFGVFFIVDLL